MQPSKILNLKSLFVVIHPSLKEKDDDKSSLLLSSLFATKIFYIKRKMMTSYKLVIIIYSKTLKIKNG
jgi:hypothetical protein